MLKNTFTRPPMGWNSYDYYDTAVDEKAVLANAEYMAQHLKPFGWEYVVIDIQWYAGNVSSMRNRYQYIPFGKVYMDEYARLLPDPERFPSSIQNGVNVGFAPLAEKIHSMGLKFGIHIMRGMPREAAHNHMPILGAKETADNIVKPESVCWWNPDMYGVRNTPDGQAWYNSIIDLYDSWGVDYIKCDDICNTTLYPDRFAGADDLMMLSNAVKNAKRDIVLSLSPGPAIYEKKDIYCASANMWRITDDFWDNWNDLYKMFERCDVWQSTVGNGNYPDCDMLPLGMIGMGFTKQHTPWHTKLTADEQKTMMSLWCMFRSPLMLGAEMTLLDPETLNLITNSEVLELNMEGRTGTQQLRTDTAAVWVNKGSHGDVVLGIFNLADVSQVIDISLPKKYITCPCKNLWTKEISTLGDVAAMPIPAHGVMLVRLLK